MAVVVAIVERWCCREVKIIVNVHMCINYGLSNGMKKSGYYREVAISGTSAVIKGKSSLILIKFNVNCAYMHSSSSSTFTCILLLYVLTLQTTLHLYGHCTAFCGDYH